MAKCKKITLNKEDTLKNRSEEYHLYNDIDYHLTSSYPDNYIHRMETEQKELKDKIDKLSNFINSDKYKELSDVKCTLLKYQIEAMKKYYKILSARILLEREI